MIDEIQLDRFKDAARSALEAYLAALTLPSLMDHGPTRPLKLTLTAALQTSGPLPAQSLALTVTPLQTLTETSLITFGATPKEPEKIKPLESCVSSEDLTRLDDLLKS